MTFNSIQYGVFLIGVVVLYWRLGLRAQNVLLLVMSYVFYGAWDWRFLTLIWISTLVDYSVGRGLERYDDQSTRKALLFASVATNLGILGFFKYFGFFTDSFQNLLGRMGMEILAPSVDIVLPVGISFYTFQTMSYTIDVYRRRMPVERNLVVFATFVAFFPQLVAGPIERASHLIPQIASPRRRLSAGEIESGLALIALGLFKKVAIADAVAGAVSEAFDRVETQGWINLVVAVWLFALQIYGDFSGYSDIARGSARLLGVDLMRNFEQPYLSTNITAFWRTWHISLSSWLHDYLYIPLGGNRRGTTRTEINLLLTMLLGGLWHGAAWTFVIWGGIQGLYLSVHKRLGDLSKVEDSPRFTWRSVPAAFATFNLVCLGWVFFRADDVGTAWDYLWRILTLQPGGVNNTAVGLLVLCGSAVLLVDVLQRNSGSHVPMLGWRPAYQGAALGVMLSGIILFSGGTSVPFIYFQF